MDFENQIAGSYRIVNLSRILQKKNKGECKDIPRGAVSIYYCSIYSA